MRKDEKGERARGMMNEEMKTNPAAEKSFSFALRIVKLYQHLSDRKKEFVLSRKLWKRNRTRTTIHLSSLIIGVIGVCSSCNA